MTVYIQKNAVREILYKNLAGETQILQHMLVLFVLITL